MNSRLRRLLLPLLRAVKEGRPISFRMRSAARQAIYLIEKPVSLKSKAAKVRQRSEKQSARASHNQETAAIRERVFGRACGLCEVSGCLQYATDLDHWLGGTGRRRQQQSFETCWALCAEHHRDRTEHRPSAEEWNKRFLEHCWRHGLNFIPHIIHGDPAKAGGAP